MRSRRSAGWASGSTAASPRSGTVGVTAGFPQAAADGHGWAALVACPGLPRGAESSVHPRVSLRPGGFLGVRAAKGGWLMTRAAVRESATLAGRAEQARVARAFVRGVLGPGHPRVFAGRRSWSW
jgi:hypothetical protein